MQRAVSAGETDAALAMQAGAVAVFERIANAIAALRFQRTEIEREVINHFVDRRLGFAAAPHEVQIIPPVQRAAREVDAAEPVALVAQDVRGVRPGGAGVPVLVAAEDLEGAGRRLDPHIDGPSLPVLPVQERVALAIDGCHDIADGVIAAARHGSSVM